MGMYNEVNWVSFHLMQSRCCQKPGILILGKPSCKYHNFNEATKYAQIFLTKPNGKWSRSTSKCNGFYFLFTPNHQISSYLARKLDKQIQKETEMATCLSPHSNLAEVWLSPNLEKYVFLTQKTFQRNFRGKSSVGSYICHRIGLSRGQNKHNSRPELDRLTQIGESFKKMIHNDLRQYLKRSNQSCSSSLIVLVHLIMYDNICSSWECQ